MIWTRPKIGLLGNLSWITRFTENVLVQQKLRFVLFQRLTCGLISLEAGLRRKLREDFNDLVTLAVPDTFQ